MRFPKICKNRSVWNVQQEWDWRNGRFCFAVNSTKTFIFILVVKHITCNIKSWWDIISSDSEIDILFLAIKLGINANLRENELSCVRFGAIFCFSLWCKFTGAFKWTGFAKAFLKFTFVLNLMFSLSQILQLFSTDNNKLQFAVLKYSSWNTSCFKSAVL